jgi:hypothetical protein
MSSAKKLETVLSLIQVAETNLKNAQNLILQLSQEKGLTLSPSTKTAGSKSREEETSLEVQEGYFDGESMVGDNGQIYPVPQNYASKTQLIVGDRMKWILTNDRDIFKLIQPAARQRVTGTFNIEGDNYVVLVDEYPAPIKILKASATYAIKNLGLKPGDEVALYVPKDTTPTWGAFIAVVRATDESEKPTISSQDDINEALEEDIISELKLNEDGPASAVDYF